MGDRLWRGGCQITRDRLEYPLHPNHMFRKDILLFLLLVGIVLLLSPLALYGIFLTVLNYRRHPTLIPGPWDCASLLLGLSGFLILAGPFILTRFHSRWRDNLQRVDLRAALQTEITASVVWPLLFVAYLILVVCGVGLLVWLRRGTISIYHITADQLSERLAIVLERLGLRWRQIGNQVYINCQLEPVRHSEKGDFVHAGAEEQESAQLLVLTIDPFAALRHITLKWPGPAHRTLQRAIEAELARELHRIVSTDNPAAAWLATATFSLISLIAFAIGLTIIVLWHLDHL